MHKYVSPFNFWNVLLVFNISCNKWQRFNENSRINSEKMHFQSQLPQMYMVIVLQVF